MIQSPGGKFERPHPRRFFAAGVVACIAAALLLAGGAPACASVAGPTPVMGVDELRPGMRAVARTVFQGTRVDSFELRILGVMRRVSPGGDLILARADGDSLRRMGVVQGMSGSPVYVDGRLIGAIAFSWEFSREPIAGITPIGEMLSLLDTERMPERFSRVPPAISPRDSLPPRGGRPPESPVHPREDQPPRGPAQPGEPGRSTGEESSILGGEFGADAWPTAGDAAEPRALPTPITVSGVDSRAAELLRGEFARHGLSLIPAGGAGAGEDSLAAGDLEPGSAVGVLLAGGDATVAAIGTLTWRDGDRLLAFGHPLFQAGNVDLPLTAAYVHATIPLESRSFKVASPTGTLGVITADRRTGVVARLGLAPDLIPLEVSVSEEENAPAAGHAAGARTYEFHYQLVRDRDLTPLLAAALAMNSMLAGGALSQEGLLDIGVEAELAGGRRLAIEDHLSSMLPPMALAEAVQQPLQILVQNPFAAPEIHSLAVRVGLGAGGQYAYIAAARLERSAYAPGDTAEVVVDLVPYRGDRFQERARIPLPTSVRGGELTLRVSDADSLTLWDAQRAPDKFAPRSFDQLVSLLDELRPHNVLYLTLASPSDGRVVEGREFAGLPGTILATMRAGGDASELRSTRMETLAEVRVAEPFQVIGHRDLVVRVKPRGRS